MSMWVKDTEKLEKAREHFAAKNRAVAAVKRKIDAIPSVCKICKPHRLQFSVVSCNSTRNNSSRFTSKWP